MAGFRSVFDRYNEKFAYRSFLSIGSSIRAISSFELDILIIADRLPVIEAVKFVKRSQDACGTVGMVFVTDDHELCTVFQRSTITGPVHFISRYIEPSELITQLTLVYGHLAASTMPPDELRKPAQHGIIPEHGPTQIALTRRESEIAQLVAQGMTNSRIAERINVKTGTVKVHVYRIYKKFGVTTRIGLLRMLN